MGRSIEKSVVIGAPPDVVWRAITEAEELSRWFPIEARVTPGLGGSIWLSWGPGTEGEAPITAWEPGRRLQWTQSRGAVKITVDFYIEAQGGGTVVRLVQAGFGDGPEWDDEFHMTDGGWSYFVQHLRWYLERHRGLPRQVIMFRDPTTTSQAATFERLLGPAGLSTDGSLLTLTVGDSYAVTTAAGDRFSGEIVALSRTTGQMALTIRELGDAMLFLEMEPHPDGACAGFYLSTYRLDDAAVAQARTKARQVYEGALAPRATC
jgi:uncharacterized protein YndB with AHSA1/START domain